MNHLQRSITVKKLSKKIGTLKSIKSLQTITNDIYYELENFFIKLYEPKGSIHRETFETYLSNFLIGDDDIIIKLQNYIENFFIQKKIIMQETKKKNYNSIIYKAHSEFIYDKNNNAIRKVVPPNVVLVISTPVNRLSYAKINSVNKNNKKLFEKMTNKTKTHKGSFYYILKNLLCIDKYINENNKKTINNKFDYNLRKFFQNSTILFPGQYYYDLSVSYNKDEEESRGDGIFVDGIKVNVDLYQFTLSEEIERISNFYKDTNRISYIFPLGCRNLKNLNTDIYINELISYSINYLLSDCKKNISSNYLTIYSKTSPHTNEFTNTTNIKTLYLTEIKPRILGRIIDEFSNYLKNNEKNFKFYEDTISSISRNYYSIINKLNINELIEKVLNLVLYTISLDENGSLNFKNLIELISTLLSGQLYVIEISDYMILKNNLDEIKKYVYNFYKNTNIILNNLYKDENEKKNCFTIIDSILKNYNNKLNEIYSKEKGTFKSIIDNLNDIYERIFTYTILNPDPKINELIKFLFHPFNIAILIQNNSTLMYQELITLSNSPPEFYNYKRTLPRLGRNARITLLSKKTTTSNV